MPEKLSHAQVRYLQEGMNAFVKRYLHGIQPIRADGDLGPATRNRIRSCKYYLGYRRPISTVPDEDFRHRIRHPRSVRFSSLDRIRRGAQRRITQRQENKAHRKVARATVGVSRYGAVYVANAAVPILNWCKQHGWRGWVVSGYREPGYSQSLCYKMCGRPSCPGRCAGVSSNHVGKTPQRFAIDVSYYGDFGRIVAKCPISPHIHNSLGARDPVHFSPSGI
jgi:hypothetical protein